MLQLFKTLMKISKMKKTYFKDLKTKKVIWKKIFKAKKFGLIFIFFKEQKSFIIIDTYFNKTFIMYLINLENSKVSSNRDLIRNGPLAILKIMKSILQ